MRRAVAVGLIVFALHFAATMLLQAYGVSTAVSRARTERETLHADEQLSHAMFNVLTWPGNVFEAHVHTDNLALSFAVGSLFLGSAAAACVLLCSRLRTAA